MRAHHSNLDGDEITYCVFTRRIVSKFSMAAPLRPWWIWGVVWPWLLEDFSQRASAPISMLRTWTREGKLETSFELRWRATSVSIYIPTTTGVFTSAKDWG